MVYRIILTHLLLFWIAAALQISTLRPYYRDGEFQGENCTEACSKLILNSPDIEVFTTGFERTDIYDILNSQWIRAKVIPIGICFQEGNGSVVLSQMMVTSLYVLRVTNTYVEPDCRGGYSTLVRKLPIVNIFGEFEHIINFVADVEAALEINSYVGDGLIIS